MTIFGMIVVRNKIDLQKKISEWKAMDLKVGFVPTMGALHEGHLSLMKIAKSNADRCVVSIFVNPTQFAPHEDFDKYPRDEKRDLDLLRSVNVDLVYLPSVADIYPNGPAADLKAGPAAQGLETLIRPGHFDGVVSVVARLFAQVGPDIAIFGEKDFQQLQVIREMAQDKKLPIEIIPGPIARDEFGLALSSRNAYLSPEELKIARRLNVILSDLSAEALAKAEAAKNCPPTLPSPHWGEGYEGLAQRAYPELGGDIIEDAKEKLLAAGFDEVQYLETRWNRLLAAVKLGKLRLIDNVAVQ